MIRVVCGCGKAFRVGGEHAGRRIKCPGCGGAAVVPEPEPDLVAASPGGETSLDAPKDVAKILHEAGWDDPTTGRTGAERLAALENEVEALRASARRRTWAFGGVLAAMTCAWLATEMTQTRINSELGGRVTRLGSARAPRIIEAEGFVVKDRKGDVRVSLGRSWPETVDPNDGIGLHLYTDGKERSEFALNGGGVAVLSLKDAKQNERVILYGEGGSAGMTISDDQGNLMAELAANDGGSTILVMNAKKFGPRIEMGVKGSKGEPAFFDVYNSRQEHYMVIGDNGLPVAGGAPR